MFKLHNYILIQNYQILHKLIWYVEPNLLDVIIPNAAWLEFRISIWSTLSWFHKNWKIGWEKEVKPTEISNW
jgi:hypothetical protein